jgi:hypothetical protein
MRESLRQVERAQGEVRKPEAEVFGSIVGL